MTIHLDYRCGGHWGEHPSFPPSDWAHEALNDETRLGYWDWVQQKFSRNRYPAMTTFGITFLDEDSKPGFTIIEDCQNMDEAIEYFFQNRDQLGVPPGAQIDSIRRHS